MHIWNKERYFNGGGDEGELEYAVFSKQILLWSHLFMELIPVLQNTSQDSSSTSTFWKQINLRYDWTAKIKQ